MIKSFLIITICVICVPIIEAQTKQINSGSTSSNIYILTNKSSLERIGGRFTFLVDEENKLSFEELAASSEFFSVKNNVPNFQVSSSAIWGKIILTCSSEAEWFLSFTPATYAEFTFYVRKNKGQWKITENGALSAGAAQRIQLSQYMLKLDMKPGDTTELFVRVKDYTPVSFDVKAGPVEQFLEPIHQGDVYNGICLGVLAMMFVYNLYLYFGNRNPAYLWYVLYILFSALFSMLVAGYFHLLPFFLHKLVVSMPGIIQTLFGFFGGLFTMTFLDLKNNAPSHYKFLKVLLLVVVANAIFCLTPFKQLSMNILQILGMVMSVFTIVVGIIVMRKGRPGAKYFLLGFGTYMLSLTYLILAAAGVFPIVDFTWHALLTGSVIEAVMLSFAIGDKMKLFQLEKEKAQEQAVFQLQQNEKIIRDQNMLLEQKVKERTVELQEQKELVEEKNKEVMDSIRYASRIQRALITSEKYIERKLKTMNK